MTLEEARRIKQGDVLVYKSIDLTERWLHLVTDVPDPSNPNAFRTIMTKFNVADSVLIEDVVDTVEWELIPCDDVCEVE